jgi:heat shock protein HslJ
MKKILILSLASLALFHCKSSKTTTATMLENTRWKLAEMNGLPVITPDNGKDVYFLLRDKKLEGFGGCNSITGSYTVAGDKITFTTASTRMMCGKEQMEIEDFYTYALSHAASYKIDGNTLELYEGETSLAEFQAAK